MVPGRNGGARAPQPAVGIPTYGVAKPIFAWVQWRSGKGSSRAARKSATPMTVALPMRNDDDLGNTPEPRVAYHSTHAEFDCDVAALYGEKFVPHLSVPPSSAFLAEGSSVTVRRGRSLAS